MMVPQSQSQSQLVAGRYALANQIASGGMGSVHLGRVLGAAGFRRTVAIKRLHSHLARDAELVSMFVDEARIAARIRHPNVIGTIDVVAVEGDLLLVMEYVHGESLSRLARAHRERKRPIPLPIVSAALVGALLGLHAAHEATNERGELLGLVHRDVSPENILVGTDGIARVLDFGVAKAAGRLQFTRDGRIKGKPSYMAPEQVVGGPVDRRCDVYAAGVVLWELLANKHLFRGDSDSAIFHQALTAAVAAPSTHVPDVPPALDEIVMRALSRAPESRYPDARQLALALEATVAPATSRQLGEWVEETAREALAGRARAVADFESLSFEEDDPPTRQMSSTHARTDGVDPPTVAYRRPSGQATRPESSTGADQLSQEIMISVAGERPELDTSATRVQVTQLSSSSSAPGGRSSPDVRPASWGMVALAATMALFVGGTVAVWLTRTGAGGSAQSVAAKAPIPSPPVASYAPAVSGDRDRPGASAEAPASSGLTAPPSGAPSRAPKGLETTPPPRQPKQPPVAPAVTARAPRPEVKRPSGGDPCDPPWTKDAEGIKHPKVECL